MMFQNYIVAAGTIQWLAVPVLGARRGCLSAADDRLVAVSESVHRTGGQSTMLSCASYASANNRPSRHCIYAVPLSVRSVAARRIIIRGYSSPEGLGDGSLPVGSRGKAPVGGLGSLFPEVQAVC